MVKDAGGYLGICAGAYLGTCRYEWGLKLLDAKTVDSNHWRRGTGAVDVELSDAGRRILGDRAGAISVRYANGPLLGPGGQPDLPGYEVLAYFRTELAKNGAPSGVMATAAAVVAAAAGKGRVMLVSPHPEAVEGLEWIVENAVRWTAGRPPTAVPPPTAPPPLPAAAAGSAKAPAVPIEATPEPAKAAPASR